MSNMVNSKTSPAIETAGLTKNFGKFTAVDGLDLKINSGEVYGLLGPNGAGKTTTVKMLCGLIKPTSGKATLAGFPAGTGKASSAIGYMPQEIALYEGLSVHQNILFFGGINGLARSDIEKKEEELLEFIDLQKWKKELVHNLSGGMKHRVSLACALVHDPILLLLDEPTVGVDPELRASFWDYFDNLKESGSTIVITTHYMDEASHCDRVGFMRYGKLIAEDKPDEILRKTGAVNLEDAFLQLTGGEK